jgi:hypothetical protein
VFERCLVPEASWRLRLEFFMIFRPPSREVL